MIEKQSLAAAVREAAVEHARRIVAAKGHAPSVPAVKLFDCTHILVAIDEAPAGINPKVRIALTSIVKHVGELERRLSALESRR